MNISSSRSHSVLLITVSQKDAEQGSTKVGRLSLVDLAGSEKVTSFTSPLYDVLKSFCRLVNQRRRVFHLKR
jgi:hypothetical protein